MSEITCKVCGNKFTPFKSRKYEVVIPSFSFGLYSGQPRIGEAFDCPMCGCQHIVNTRYEEVEAQKLRFQGILTKKDAEMILNALKKTEESEELNIKNPICRGCKEYGSEMCDNCSAWNNYKYYEPALGGED